MRKLFSLRYYALCLLLEHLFLQRMTSFALGSFESVSAAKCEYEDANLIWRNTPAYSLNDVKAMAWYKGKDSLIASWLEGKGFKEYPPYIGRLMQIGETGIKIKRANRSDSGSYWLSLTLASTDHKLEAVTHLEVIVAPSSQCKPNITEEGSILKAEVPSEWCGTPPLSPKWKNTSKTLIQTAQNPSLLDLGGDFEAGEYIVCAEGYSAICYQGNVSDLCTAITKSHNGRRDDGWTPNLVSIILPVVLVVLIFVVVSISVIRWKRKLFRENKHSEQLCLTMEDKATDEAFAHDEEYSLTEKENVSMKGLPEIQNYLRSLYKDMTSVSLSPTGKENIVDVSEVFIDLDFQHVETKDFKYIETDLTCTKSHNASSSKARNQNVSPIIIVGCRGSGKSTWCKHLVQSWSQNTKTEEANVQGIKLHNLGEYQILLYLPLKSSDRKLSFQELLQQTLFQGQPDYLNIITRYMHDESHAQSILILIDGSDIISEYVKPMSEVFSHKLLSICTVICTCRPRSLKLIFNACVDNSIQLELFKVCEIPLDKSTTYASTVLSRLNQDNKDFNIKNFLTFTRNLHVQSLLSLPYLCLTLLFVWLENKNPYMEITDILLRIMEHLLDTAKTEHHFKENIMKLSQRNSPEVRTSVNKLDERFVKIKGLMYELSMATEEIFLPKTKGLADEDRLIRGTSARGKDTLSLEVLYEAGLVTESVPLKSADSLSTMTFTNVLIYQLFLSMAIAFKKGYAFDYIVSDVEIALKNSMTIHMLWQFSPTVGKEMFAKISKLKSNKRATVNLAEHSNNFRCSITKTSKGKTHKVTKSIRIRQVMWLQYLMYKGDLDDEKLLFLTNALRSMNSLTSLVLENNENNNSLVFWLPCSQTLKTLELSINNCTLLLCPEWNHQIPFKLREVVIKSVIISCRDHEVFCKALLSCSYIKKQEVSLTVVSTGDIEIVP